MRDDDNTLTRMVEALARRVEALEEENTQLRAVTARPAPGAEAGLNRRQLFAGGAGLLGALGGGALLAGAPAAHAASAPSAAAHGEIHRDDGATSSRLANARVVALHVTLAPERGGGHHSALYTWKLGAHFTGAVAPVVVASAHDDHHGTGAAAAPSCAVAVTGRPGAYEATIRVNNVGHWATAVTLHAVAIGE